MKSTVPEELSTDLLDFCACLSKERPVFIPSAPSVGAHMGMCFDNVAQKIKQFGGRILYGWAIWHNVGCCYEAEHHAAWEAPDGKILDVTPQFGGVTRVLFLPDQDAAYDAQKYRSNVLKAEPNNPKAEEFVVLARRIYEIRDKYRVGESTQFVFSSTDQREIESLQYKIARLAKAMNLA